MHVTARASFVVFFFSLLALWAFAYLAPETPELLPHALFFAALITNTFFSVRFWSQLQPKHISQGLIDTALVVSYAALALSIGRPGLFALSALFLFILAPVKYVLMLGELPHTAVIRRKVVIDLMGTASCAVLLLLIFLGYSLLGAWLFAGLFLIANIYLLIINPMYRL